MDEKKYRFISNVKIEDPQYELRSQQLDYYTERDKAFFYGKTTIVGEDCSITHHATLHGCDIGDRCLIGINATIMDGAKIGENSIVAGHTIITENKVFPPNSVIAGVPGKVVATRDCGDANLLNARFYSACAEQYREGIDRLPDEALAQFSSLAKPVGS